ncbi:hypothetical protein PC116_g34591 [Phytophthora cactorum]|nr:hypothetical protein PC116_g34591 [Phytophthora cactorum]
MSPNWPFMSTAILAPTLAATWRMYHINVFDEMGFTAASERVSGSSTSLSAWFQATIHSIHLKISIVRLSTKP